MTVPAQAQADLRLEDDGRVPFADLRPMHDEIASEIDDAWKRLRTTGRFIGGPAVERFEQEWASYCGVQHAVGVANGTDALVLALRALGIGPGDEVIVPANTFIATAEAVVLAGAIPVFVDVHPESLLLTATIVDAAVTERTAAVMVVHLYGHMPDMEALVATARRHRLALVEDAAQAHGSSYAGKRAGSFGDVACFSFYPGKNLGAFGDGGAVVTNDDALARELRCMADHGRTEGTKYEHRLVGTNSRLDALQACVLSAKLMRLDAWTAGRRMIVDVYRDQLALGGLRLVEPLADVMSAWHLLVSRVEDRETVRTVLGLRGVEDRKSVV